MVHTSDVHIRAGPQNEKWSNRQNTLDPAGSVHKKARRKKLAHEKLILMRGVAVENLKTPIMGSKIKDVVNFIYGHQNLSGEK